MNGRGLVARQVLCGPAACNVTCLDHRVCVIDNHQATKGGRARHVRQAAASRGIRKHAISWCAVACPARRRRPRRPPPLPQYIPLPLPLPLPCRLHPPPTSTRHSPSACAMRPLHALPHSASSFAQLANAALRPPRVPLSASSHCCSPARWARTTARWQGVSRPVRRDAPASAPEGAAAAAAGPAGWGSGGERGQVAGVGQLVHSNAASACTDSRRCPGAGVRAAARLPAAWQDRWPRRCAAPPKRRDPQSLGCFEKYNNEISIIVDRW